jgi:uncharacterized protein (TIGR03083 family)
LRVKLFRQFAHQKPAPRLASNGSACPFCRSLWDACTARLAALVDTEDPALPIPACPDWTLRQLATHVGRAHRWATQIVATRSAEFIEFRSVPDARSPADQAQRGRWLTARAAMLIGALRGYDERVWAFSQRLSQFWARRMAHETLVHCADAQQAAATRWISRRLRPMPSTNGSPS